MGAGQGGRRLWASLQLLWEPGESRDTGSEQQGWHWGHRSVTNSMVSSVTNKHSQECDKHTQHSQECDKQSQHSQECDKHSTAMGTFRDG